MIRYEDFNEHYEKLFWDKVDIKEEDKCWEWKSKAKTEFGYGVFGLLKKTDKAHRIAFRLFYKNGRYK